MEPTEEIIKREIAAARDIIREDRIMAKLGKHFPDTDEDTGSGEGDPNKPKAPKKEDKPPTGTQKRGGLWWGDATSE